MEARRMLTLLFVPLAWRAAHGAWDYSAVQTDMNCASCSQSTEDMRTALLGNSQTACNETEVYNQVTSIVQCKDCDGTNVAEGYYCHNGAVDLCNIGYYCPSPLEEIKCPEGTWCKRGFSAPVDCRVGIICDAGAEIQRAGLGLILSMLVFLVCLSGCTCGITARNSKSATRMREAAAVDELQEVDFSEELNIDVPKLTIEFEDLSMHLKVNGDCVLDRITGKFPQASLVSCMGPSGGGKTTFMNALCGRANYGVVTGTTRLNGKVGSVTDFPKSIGFVPQDDIMHADLTVQQNIYYNAKLRLPAGTPQEKIMAHTNHVVKVLGLSHVAQNLVGSPEKRGISGGQKKRVNIGMELAAMPAVIFMDEPTSGLDGAATIQLAQILAKLQASGLTIVCVIHQPRYAVFAKFSHLLLLGAGGGQVYCGETLGMEKYFNEIGFRCPPKENPADWMIDVTCGLAPRYKAPDSDEVDHTFRAPQDLFKLWEEKYKGKASPYDGPQAAIGEPIFGDRITRGFFGQTRAFLAREARKWSRSDFLTTVSLLFFSGVALGIVMQAIAEFSYAAILPLLTAPTNLFYMICTINTRTIYAAERLEFLREFSSGTSCSAYWLAKTLWSCINWVMYAMSFAVPVYWLMPLPAQPFGQFFQAYLWAAWYHIGLGMLITLAYSTATTALLLCTFLPIVLELAASGAITPIKDMNGIFRLLSVFSCGRWFKTGIFANEMAQYPAHTLEFEDVRSVFEDYEADVNDGQHAFLMLFIVGLLMRLWCWFTLYLLQNAQGTGCVSRVIFLVKKSFHAAGLETTGHHQDAPAGGSTVPAPASEPVAATAEFSECRV